LRKKLGDEYLMLGPLSGISVEEAAEAGVEAVIPEPLSFTAVSALSTQDLG
jgi:hypothetical protein